MNDLTKRLLNLATEKRNPNKCPHHFATCEECGSRINIIRLLEIFEQKKGVKSECKEQ